MIIIPCAGQQTRWDRPYPKHLAQLPTGETVLARLIDQCFQFQVSRPRVYTSDDGVSQVALSRHAKAIVPYPEPTLTEFLTATLPSWTGDVWILLGDVVFSPAAIANVLRDQTGMRFFGSVKQGEIFAFHCHAPQDTSDVMTALHIANAYARAHREDGGGGKLWSLYRAFIGWPQEKEVEDVYDNWFVDITDWTTDLDYGQEYDALCRVMESLS